MASELNAAQILSLFQSVALEVQMEELNQKLARKGSQQRYNAQGQPLRRTPEVDPEYHRSLNARRDANSRDASLQRARQRSMA